MKKFLFVLLGVALVGAAYFGYTKYIGNSEKNSDNEIVYTIGNNSGNIANSGYLVRNKNALYGNINTEHSGIFKSDLKFKNQVKISDDEGLFINTDGEWLYYVNFTDKHTIYRVRVNGTDRERLNTNESDSLNWENDWLYYLDRKNGSVICKMSSDGKIKKVLLNQKYCSNLLVKDGWIYYILKGALHRINVDGNGHSIITNIRTTYYENGITWRGNYDVCGDYVYYPNDDGGLYKIRTDGQENTLLKSGNVESINIYKNYIYYYNSKLKIIYRVSIDNPENAEYVVGGGLYYNINIVNDNGVIYKDKSISDGPLYMVLMDLSKK
jgi:phage pi2 protein 07